MSTSRPLLLLTILASTTALSGLAHAEAAADSYPEIGGWGQAWGDDDLPPPASRRPPPMARPSLPAMPAGYRPPPPAVLSPAYSRPAAPVRPVAAPPPPYPDSYPEIGGWGQAWGDDEPPPPAPRRPAAIQTQAQAAPQTRAAPPPAARPVAVPAAADPSPPAAAPPPSPSPPAASARQAAPSPHARIGIASDVDRDGDAIGMRHPPRVRPTGLAPRRDGPGDGDQPVLMEADQLIHDREYGIVTAKGRVEMQQAGRTITADTVTYNLKHDVMGASGNVVLTEPTGEVTFADYVQLTGDFKTGVARDIRMILADNSRLAARTGQRTGGDRTDFDQVVYTACEPCRDKPDATPIWQARAARVTHNQGEAQIEYRDVWIELAGVPVLYTPYMSHPDPSVRRKSGVLAPSVGFHNKLGPSLTTPYFFALSPHQDITLTPRFMFPQTKLPADSTVDGVTNNAMRHLLLGAEHRWLGKTGEMKTQASITTDRITGEVRGHVDSKAVFDLNRVWRAGWQVQHHSDRTFRTLYRVRTENDRPWLVTRPYLEAFGRRSYAMGETLSFQGNTVIQDSTRSPVVLPHVVMQNISEPGWAGSYWTFDSDVLAYTRSRGTGAQRLSHRAAWNLPVFTPDGQAVTLSTSLRGDAYRATELSTTSDGRSSIGRVIPEAAVTWRYPFARPGETVSQVIEPLAMVAVSPTDLNDPKIPNEDSLGFELDETNVLRPTRLVGLDRVEGGLRGGYGLRWTAYPARGGMIGLQAAQGWRQHTDATFGEGSGFTGTMSDYLARLDIRPSGLIAISDRVRIDKSTLELRRNEASVVVGPPALNFSSTYAFLSSTTSNGVSLYPRRQYVVYAANSALTRYWRANFTLNQDIEDNGGVLGWTAATAYSDECFAVVGTMERYYSTAPGLMSGYNVTLTLVLKSLGEAPIGLF